MSYTAEPQTEEFGIDQKALLVEKLHPESIVVVTSQNGALLRDFCSQMQAVNLLVSHIAHELFATRIAHDASHTFRHKYCCLSRRLN